MDGGVPPEDEVAAVLDLLHRVVAFQVDGLTVGLGKLRPQHQRPVVEALADDVRAESVGGALQRRRIGDGEEGVVILAVVDATAEQFPFDVVVPIEVVGDLERAGRTPRTSRRRRAPRHGCRSSNECTGSVGCL